jgi:hypothetical protein
VAAYCLQRKKERKEGTLTDSTVLQKEKALQPYAIGPAHGRPRLACLRCAARSWLDVHGRSAPASNLLGALRP